MGLLQDLVNGKELQLSDSSKMTVMYATDANVLSISIGGQTAMLSQDDLSKLIEIEGILRMVKSLDNKV